MFRNAQRLVLNCFDPSVHRILIKYGMIVCTNIGVVPFFSFFGRAYPRFDRHRAAEEQDIASKRGVMTYFGSYSS